jgi:N-acyl homoserine lactone hydrolase
VEACLGYLVKHPRGLLLVDTGMGSHPEVDAHYRPRRRPLAQALAGVGVTAQDISLVVNCHLHVDHCGDNPQLSRSGARIVVQRTELEQARTTTDYTLPELLDVGEGYEQLDGEAELWPGVLVMPTPGHTDGHQSLVVRAGDGTVVIAGQTHDTATSFSSELLGLQAEQDGHRPGVTAPSSWLERLRRLDPAQVVFAHDHAVWMP